MRTAVLFVLTIAVTVSVSASEVPPQKVDQVFAVYDNRNSPGCSLGVVRDRKFVYRHAYGKASLELGVPLTTHSVFYMASVSKQFTAASIVLAAEQGYLSLDDDVRKYIPELPDYGHVITLRQMLNQTSGFRDFLALVYLSGRDIAELSSPERVLQLIVRQKALNNVPGDEFVYSNSNYFLLGVVVKRATKKSLADFAAQNIFQPLGMVDTRFYDDNTVVIPGRAAAYDPGNDGKFVVDWSTTYDIVGGGGLMSNVDDLLLWDTNFYANRLGKGMLVKQLETRGVLNNGKQINYAMGLWLNRYRGLPIVEHSGGTFGYRTELLRFPEQRFSVIVLCNLASADVEGLGRRVADLYLSGNLQRETSVARQGVYSDPARFAGRYLDPRTHMIYTFTLANGKLMAWGAVLQRTGDNQFQDLVGNPILFAEKSRGMKVTLDLQGETYFDGDKVPDIPLTDAERSAVAGRYRSEELDATYTLEIEQGSLVLKNGSNRPVNLVAVGTNEFQAGDMGTLVFYTDAQHRVSGLTLFSQAARGIDFRKVN